jgi:hypothetical protein
MPAAVTAAPPKQAQASAPISFHPTTTFCRAKLALMKAGSNSRREIISV